MLLGSLTKHGQVRKLLTKHGLYFYMFFFYVCVCVQLVDGVSQLLFEVCRGVKGQLHSCASKVISASDISFANLCVYM